MYVIIFNDTKNVVYTGYIIEKNMGGENEITIVHLSDMHFPDIKVDLNKLTENIKNKNPDIIAITGDLVDSVANNSGVDGFLDSINGICPVYYVFGNHETRTAGTPAAMERLAKDFNIRLLRNEFEKIELKGSSVTIAGFEIPDASSGKGGLSYNTQTFADAGNEGIKILLAHQPEAFEKYSNSFNLFLPDLVLSGHTHGGGIRFPLIGGIIAPNQGLFPKYADGLFQSESGTKMIISRGLGLSSLPLRVLNKPDVPVIKIKF